MWYEGSTCNMDLDRLAAKGRNRVVAAGMLGCGSWPLGLDVPFHH